MPWSGNQSHRNILPNRKNGTGWLHDNFKLVLWLLNKYRHIWQAASIERKEMMDFTLYHIGVSARYRNPAKCKDSTFLSTCVKQAIFDLVRRRRSPKHIFAASIEPSGLLFNVSEEVDVDSNFDEMLERVPDARIRYILREIFSLDKALHDIGKHLNISAARVRQLKIKGLMQIRESLWRESHGFEP